MDKIIKNKLASLTSAKYSSLGRCTLVLDEIWFCIHGFTFSSSFQFI